MGTDTTSITIRMEEKLISREPSGVSCQLSAMDYKNIFLYLTLNLYLPLTATSPLNF